MPDDDIAEHWQDAIDAEKNGELPEELEQIRQQIMGELEVGRRHGAAARARYEEDTEPRPLAPYPEFPVEILPPVMAEFVQAAVFPPALVAGAALGAVAVAVGGESQLDIARDWTERAILWIPLIAETGAGKTPLMGFAFDPIREWRRREGGSRVFVADTTVEAHIRNLEADPSTSIVVDEMTAFLQSLGEYKQGGGGDQGRMLSLWAGGEVDYSRVGGSKKAANAVEIHIDRPAVTICGGLQPAKHVLLGPEHDGMRPRWLPHMAHAVKVDRIGSSTPEWRERLFALLEDRGRPRQWTVSDEVLEIAGDARERWHELLGDDCTASMDAALRKAAAQSYRIALNLAELEAPGQGGPLPAIAMHRGIRWFEYVLDCWRALPEQGGLMLKYNDRAFAPAIERLIAWLDAHGGRASRSTLLRLKVGGANTAAKMDALLVEYEEHYPGCVRRHERDPDAHTGSWTTMVYSPRMAR
jgi:Protein of unknown function (DUF3987)